MQVEDEELPEYKNGQCMVATPRIEIFFFEIKKFMIVPVVFKRGSGRKHSPEIPQVNNVELGFSKLLS